MKLNRWIVGLALFMSSCRARSRAVQMPNDAASLTRASQPIAQPQPITPSQPIAQQPTALAPRPIAPLSLGDVTLLRPTLRWELPVGTDGALVELCRDRACTMVIESLLASGTSARPSQPLPARTVVFWRLRGTSGTTTGTAFSPTWLFHVPARDNSGLVDTSANPHLDVNGDGFDDVVVGASYAAPGDRMQAGAVSVFHGSATGVALAPALVLEGVATRDSFGGAVASAGDVNGDGFADLVVGAENASPRGRRFVGTASVFHGSAAGVAPVPTRVLEGGVGGAFGDSVASAGDVNGDGFSDVVVGTQWADAGGRTQAGTASVFHGSATGIDLAPARILRGIVRYAHFGHSVATAGDVNGDGFADLVVGATEMGDDTNVGSASVYHGSARGIAMAPALHLKGVEGIDGGDQFGYSVATAGDVNGDGFADLVVGAPWADPTGTVRVYHGSTRGIRRAPMRVLHGVASGDRFGFSVANAGDVNGDGFADVVIGATGAIPTGRPFAVSAGFVGSNNVGSASVLHGSAAGIPVTPSRVIEGVMHNDRFGSSVASAFGLRNDPLASWFARPTRVVLVPPAS